MPFTAHEHLLVDVIQRQAGTLGKAFLEGVMNSIDAGATAIELTIGPEGFVLADNGRGFNGQDEIKTYFATFGTPHKEGDRVYGTYSMGRGQLLAFAKTTWTSNHHVMKTDLQGMGLRFLCSEIAEPYRGCRVEGQVYDLLTPQTMKGVITEVTRNTLYIAVPLKINGILVNKEPSALKWDHDTEDAWIKLGSGGTSGIAIYQQGVYVETIPAYEFGLSGVVVTKVGKPLTINFARNQCLRSCSRFKRILELLGHQAKKRIARRTNLDDSERAAAFVDVRNSDGYVFPDELRSAKLFQDVTGRYWSFKQLEKLARSETFEKDGAGRLRYCFAPEGDQRADRIMQSGRGFAFSEAMADELGVDSSTGFDHIKPLRTLHMAFATIEQLSANMNGDFVTVHPSKYTPLERLVIEALTPCSYSVARIVGQTLEPGSNGLNPRALRVGCSDIADAWTDGSDYIALNRAFIARHGSSSAGFQDLALLLLHEYCSSDSTAGRHVHAPEFYRLFHDCSSRMGALAEWAQQAYVRKLRNVAEKYESERLKQEHQSALEKKAFGASRIEPIPPHSGLADEGPIEPVN